MPDTRKPDNFDPAQISVLKSKVAHCKALIREIVAIYLTIDEGGFIAGLLSGQESAIVLVEIDLNQRSTDNLDPREVLKIFRRNTTES